ncbi:MAG TPA: TrkA family potassium uptake protein [Candidatus Limnocylindrales bacterium]|jgi:trk system potassium uptake protein TrkA|nr:TrkA family potassium uptake protein [Candidatus Limnocylindrales bacterium]
MGRARADERGNVVKIVIVGCGRVGASSAEVWDKAGHEVVILDMSTRAFERLPSTFGGTAVRGDGTDEDVLRKAGAEGADVFVALTEGDNRNVMSAQLAVEAFEIPRVIAKINDPVRSAAYAELGIATICRTGLMVDAMNAHLGFPPSGLTGMLAPTGTHPGGEHHTSRGDAAASTAIEMPAPRAPMEA